MACGIECSLRLRYARASVAAHGLKTSKITVHWTGGRGKDQDNWCEVWEDGNPRFDVHTCCASDAKAQYLEWRVEIGQ